MRFSFHLITGMSFLGLSCLCLNRISRIELLSAPIEGFTSFLLEDEFLPFPVFMTVSVALYAFGTVFPDVDVKGSTVSKLIYIPLEHRTFIHSIWIPLGLILLGIFFRPLIFFAAGWLVHLLFDSFSKYGICFTYPLVRFKTSRSGYKYKKGHHGFYKTGERSEIYFLIVSLLIMAGIMTACLI